jgi:hypothetical protein
MNKKVEKIPETHGRHETQETPLALLSLLGNGFILNGLVLRACPEGFTVNGHPVRYRKASRIHPDPALGERTDEGLIRF